MSILPKQHNRRTWYIVALVFIFLLAVAGILAAVYLYNLKEKDLGKVKPDYVMTASALQKAFEVGEDLAVEKYANKIIEVTGVIGSVKYGENNSVNVSLETESNYTLVICTFQNFEDLPDLSPGQTITIRGECSGYLLDVLMNNCVLVGVKK